MLEELKELVKAIDDNKWESQGGQYVKLSRIEAPLARARQAIKDADEG